MFIPGPVQMPRKDQICVSRTAKVGDSSKNSDGDALTVKVLSGSSRMCIKPTAPILAEVELVPSSTFQSTLSIDTPEGFLPRDLTEKEKFDGYRLQASNNSSHCSLLVQSANRLYHSSASLINQRRSAEATPALVAQTPIDDLSVNGAQAKRWQTEMLTKAFIKTHYSMLEEVVEGDHEIVFMSITCPTREMARQRERYYATASSISGVVADHPASPSTESALSSDSKNP
jgi:hypothetical protein